MSPRSPRRSSRPSAIRRNVDRLGEQKLHVYSDPASERHINRMAHIEAPERFPAALAGVEEAERTGVPVEWRPCQPAPDDALKAVHAPNYLDHLKKLSVEGGGYLDLDTALNSASWEAATLASGAAIGAVESALSGTAAFAIARPPGHHAGRDYGMGFCLLHNTALAAAHAPSGRGGRVAILH